MPPTLHHPILKEIFEELLKKRAFQQNNFSMIQPLLLAGKECLAVFIELLRQVRSVTMLRSRISFELQNCFLSSESFPLGLWKMMALYIPQLIVSDFDEAYQMSMIEMMENSTRLRRIEASFDLNTEAWRYLLNTSVTEISAPIRSLIDIGKLDKHLYANIGIVETFIYIDDSALFEEFLVNFRIPCKNLKIQNVESWTSFWDVILNNFERVNFETLEKLVLKFRVKEQLPNFAELELPNRLEALQIVFPNLKELDMKIKFDDYEEYTIFGTNFVPHFLFLQLAVNELTNQIRQANIQYKLSFRFNIVVLNILIGHMMIFEENSVLYNDMMDDLEIGNFNNYGDGDYSDGDYEDDDLGIDFDN
uniref:Uncharacterized protein n=1 Tax=Panagrolaimus sp. PS1159 TaxID=55785 RepID=A0AC35GAX9_9BILA